MKNEVTGTIPRGSRNLGAQEPEGTGELCGLQGEGTPAPQLLRPCKGVTTVPVKAQPLRPNRIHKMCTIMSGTIFILKKKYVKNKY